MNAEEVRKRKGEVAGMTAIAQTLDGAVTFETTEELFNYVFSELFDFKYSLYLKLADIWDLL